MTTTGWLAGFMVFNLGAFHTVLAWTLRSRLQLWLALGWLANVPYLMAEVRWGQESILVPFVVSMLSLPFFCLTSSELGRLSVKRALAPVLIGYGLLAFFARSGVQDAWPFEALLVGSVTAAVVFVELGLELRRDNSEILSLGRGSSISRSLTVRSSRELEFGMSTDPLTGGRVRDLSRRSQMLGQKGKQVAASGFLLFGLLQLAYPWKPYFDEASWRSLFYAGMVFKFWIGLGFVVLIVAYYRLLVANLIRGDSVLELANITAAVEHDLKSPIQDIGISASLLEKAALSQHGDIRSFLHRRARYLRIAEVKARAVADMILAIRETPEEFSTNAKGFDLGGPLSRAIETSKTLFSDVEPIFDTSGVKSATRLVGSDVRLATALSHLMNNAIEATLERSPSSRPKIWLRSEVEARDEDGKAFVVVSVRDEGLGYREDALGECVSRTSLQRETTRTSTVA